MHARELTLEAAKQLIDNINVRIKLNFNGLFDLLKEKNIPLKFVEFKINAVGVATFDCIYININYIHRIDIIYFVLLHEMAHFRRISKRGFQWYLDNFINNTLENFNELIINEEIIADRYADIIGGILNKGYSEFHSYNQKLTNQENVEKYKEVIEGLFNTIPDNYEDYVKFIHENIVYVK